MALFISSLIMLFAFTVNVGMLVHAKINLQNAADAAAYAGAAVQARQLTSVAYLNYEIRRAVKEFSYLFAVKGSQALSCFPQEPVGQSVDSRCYQGHPRFNFAIWDPRNSPADNENQDEFYIPTMCMVYAPENNYCQKKAVAGVPQFQGGGSFGVADPIIAEVISATNIIIGRKTNDCEMRTSFNRQIVAWWLFSLKPTVDQLSFGALNPNERDYPFDVGGIDGLGILPRLALLRARIDRLEDSLNLNLANEGLGSSITAATIDSIKDPNRTDYFERPIQAYLSAKNNLPEVGADNGIFSNVEMVELIPNSSPFPQNTKLKNPSVLTRFNDITHAITIANALFVGNAPAGGSCEQHREARNVQSFLFGVAKDPAVPTYYAVKLKADARLLFSPFPARGGTISISAYSAAKPFGSRIGPDLNRDPRRLMVVPGALVRNDPITTLSQVFPNLLVAATDTDVAATGFTARDHLQYLWTASFVLGRSKGYRLAGAYAPWEIGFYTPPANYIDDTGNDLSQFPKNPSYGNPALENKFLLEASAIPAGATDNSITFIRNRVQEMLSGTFNDTIEGDDRFMTLNKHLFSEESFAELLGFLQTNYFDRNHPIPDPLLRDDPNLRAYAEQVGSKFTVTALPTATKSQLTSWNNRKSTADTDSQGERAPDIGRSGYSVRFVSFSSLRAGGRGSTDPLVSENWEDPFSRVDVSGSDSTFAEDLPKLKH